MERRSRLVGEVLHELTRVIVRERPRDLSLTAASTLSTLERDGPLRLGDLALCEGVTQPSMTAVVATLEQLELAGRRRDPDDGRVVLVAVTPAGRRYLAAEREVWASRFEQLVEQLPSEDAATVAAAMPALCGLLELATASRAPVGARRDAAAAGPREPGRPRRARAVEGS